tara:strand:+ start:8604 stop:9317 length:714 start_codon:yes stop_codon:yes gene_type:complete
MKKNDGLTTRSYAPYSGKEEACYVEGETGVCYPGVKIENISYPLTISALRAAICSCLANGDKPVSIFPVAGISELSEYWENEFGLEIMGQLPSDLKLYNPFIPQIDENANMIKLLDKLCDMAITPHSDFPVAALVKTEMGWVGGVNVEVSAWSLGLCAERVAIARAISHGCSQFEMIHVYAPKSEFCSPCGSCRQVLNEFMADKEIVLYHKDQSHSRHFSHHLLPYGISTNFLRKIE